MNFINKMSVRAKVFAVIILSSLLTSILGLYCLQQAELMNEKASDIGENWLPSTAKIGRLAFAVRSYRVKQVALGMRLLSGEPASDSLKGMQSELAKADAAYEAYKPLITPNTEDARLMADFALVWPKVKAMHRSILDKINAGNMSAAVEIIADPTTMHEAENILLKDLEINENEGQKAADSVGSTYSSVFKGIIAGIAIAFALTMVLGWQLVRSIVTPLSRSTSAIAKLSEGDLAVDIVGKERGDELGLLARSLELFKAALIDQKRLEREAEAQRLEQIAREEAQRRAEVDAQRKAEADRIAAEEDRRRAQAEAIESERMIVTSSIGAAITKLAQKDLTYRITQDIPEAYRTLKDDFNKAIGELEAAIEGVAERADSIATGTREIASGSDQLARRTETQAAALEESAAALASITETVQNAAKGAAHARDVVTTAKNDAEKSSGVVKTTVAAMANIEKSSQQIGQIISVIDEIAFQTNLLALNAGVEAARAGDAGRGFAVVASEVRALAQRSAEAAKEIKGLITASGAQVAEGVALVDETGRSLERILTQISEINVVVGNIASGAIAQATGIEEVNQAIAQMDQNTQQNASMAEETNAAGQTLATDAGHLSDVVLQFKIGSSAAGRSSRKPDATTHQVRALRNKVATAHPAKPAAKPMAKVANGGDWEEF